MATHISELTAPLGNRYLDGYLKQQLGTTRKKFNRGLHARQAGIIKVESFFDERCHTYKFGYHVYKKRKPSGGTRTIHIPHPDLAELQTEILYYLLQFPAADCAHGFVRGRSYLSVMQVVAKNRAAHPYIFFFDVRHAFPSINKKEIGIALKSLGLDAPIANRITFLCTTKDGFLPQGAPTSPHLLNLVYRTMDEELLRFCESHSIIYLRYVDNLIFMCPSPIKKNTLYSKVPIDIVRSYGRKIHPPVFCDNPSLDVRLLGLNLVGDEVHLKPETKDRFRQILFLAAHDSSYYEQARGVIANLCMIYGELPPRFTKQLEQHPLLKPTR